jgi:hypothetical protein
MYRKTIIPIDKNTENEESTGIFNAVIRNFTAIIAPTISPFCMADLFEF